MNCRQARLDIALCVGEDLTDADRRENLRNHLTSCSECRSHVKRLNGMFHVLEQAEGQQTYDSVDSLWPGLVGRLGQPGSRMQRPRSNGWAPFSVMSAACILLMIAMEMQPEANNAISVLPKGIGVFSVGGDGDTGNPERGVETADSASLAPSPEKLAPPSNEPR